MGKSKDFYDAAAQGNLRLVQKLAKDPAVKINWQNKLGYSPFNIACQEGKAEVVRFLLGLEGLEVNLPCSEEETPFFMACQNGHVDVVSLLLADKRINFPGDEPISFFVACQEGHVAVVSLLLADQRVDVNQTPDQGSTPFFVACYDGHVGVISLLLADKRVEKDFNKPWENGQTPFFVACLNGHVRAVSLLLEDQRVNVNQPEVNGCTPLYVACQNGLVDVVSTLLGHQRVDIDQSRNNGATPLWIASNQGYFVLVQHLLASGREIDTKKICTFNNKTAAAQARSLGSRTVKDYGESDEKFQKRKAHGPKIADLIESFERNPKRVRAELRRELFDPSAGELFALVVFLSDGYLQIPRSQNSLRNEKSLKAQKFFSLALRLPLDLQMVLCNRAFGLEASIIKRIHSEKGFKKFGF